MNVRRRTSRRELRVLLHSAARRPVPAVAVTDFVPAAPEATAGAVSTVTRTAGVATRRELRVLLRAAGSRPVPPAAPSFLAQLEAELGEDAAPATASPAAARHSRVRAASLAAAAAALVLVAGLTGVFGGPGSETGLALSVAVDTSVTLPDGTTVDGVRGLALPDGAVVRTGPEGRAVAGGSELGPRAEAVVRAGRLHVLGDVVETTPADPLAPGDAGPTGSAPAAGAAPADQGRPAAPAVPPVEADSPPPPPPPPPPALPSIPLPTLPTLPLPDLGVPGSLPLL